MNIKDNESQKLLDNIKCHKVIYLNLHNFSRKLQFDNDDNCKCFKVNYGNGVNFADQLESIKLVNQSKRGFIDSINIEGLGAVIDNEDRIYFPQSSSEVRYIIIDGHGNPLNPYNICVYGISNGDGYYEPTVFPSEEAAHNFIEIHHDKFGIYYYDIIDEITGNSLQVIFNENDESMQFVHKLTGNLCESVDQAFSGWSEQDPDDQAGWERIKSILKSGELDDFISNNDGGKYIIPRSIEITKSENNGMDF